MGYKYLFYQRVLAETAALKMFHIKNKIYSQEIKTIENNVSFVFINILVIGIIKQNMKMF